MTPCDPRDGFEGCHSGQRGWNQFATRYRNGPTGNRRLKFIEDYARFEDLEG